MQIRLLVAEDEDTIRNGVIKYIRLHTDRFTQIYEAKNGQEAIDLLLKYQPEILLLDVQMPLKSGIEVMQAAWNAGLQPIMVVLSGYDEFKYAHQALRYGAKEYLLKPVRASDILKCLNELVDKYIGAEEKVVSGEDAEQIGHLIKAAREYIGEHYHENLSLNDVAEQVGISGGYLSTLFTQQLNCGFVDYLNQVRIERACCYLEQKCFKNYEIAFRVGFRDEKYFSKVFKKVMGMTPREYRSREEY